jgi:phosphate acetyltransferase
MSFLDDVLKKASREVKTIVFPEGSDQRIIEAAKILADRKLVRPIIIGQKDKISAELKNLGKNNQALNIVEPSISEHRELFAENLYELRKHKGLTLERARDKIVDELYFGTMMVKTGMADGLVAGAAHSTADTIRPALQIIKPIEGVKTISSIFFMCFPEATYLFADCGIVEKPTIFQIADITVSTAATAIQFGLEPRIAILSYSSKGSARGEDALKMSIASERAKEKIENLFGFGGPVTIDGELQFDAAFVPEVAAKKAPDSPLKGRANIFIFPDLNSGNICYKAVQRLARIEAYGPVLQGLAKPVNDLSRGCTTEEIVATAAITAIQAMI